jgi:inhibitor of KinA
VIINYLSETAITLTFDDKISLEIHQKVIAFYGHLKGMELPWILDIVPAYSSVSVYVSLDFYKKNSSLEAYFRMVYEIFKSSVYDNFTERNDVIFINVDYNGEDLAYVASYCKLSVNEVIRIHSETEYTVAMLGFAPGFPYLLGLDKRLIIPRRATPRLKVPAGSVAIGGVQTGIYPKESPGGWHIISSTSVDLFDVSRNPPNLLNPGIKIKFIK